MNSYNPSRLGPSSEISILEAFYNNVTLKYTVHTMPVSLRKTSWFGLNTLISALNCSLRLSFR